MKVSEVMTEKVLYCRQDASANAAAQLMWENNCGAVPIVDENLKPVGILTDRDICMAAYTQGLPLGSILVTSAMAREPVHRLMRAHQIRRLPVVDAQGKISGVVALADLARAAQGREALEVEVGRTLTAISCAAASDTVGKQHLVEPEPTPASQSTPGPSRNEGTAEGPGQETSSDLLSGASATRATTESTKPYQPGPSTLTGPAAEAPPVGHPGSASPPTPHKPENPTPRPPSRRRGPRQR
jgi:CBS domain-containing protein